MDGAGRMAVYCRWTTVSALPVLSALGDAEEYAAGTDDSLLAKGGTI